MNYHLRMANQKKEAVQRFKEINFKVIAAGDSYNDTAMLKEPTPASCSAPRTTSSPSSPVPGRTRIQRLMAQIRAASARI